MKVLLNFFKNNLKIFIAFLVGAIIFSGVGYAVAATIQSQNVSYTGNGQTNVKGAVDELYNRVCKLYPKMEDMCPGCVYVYSWGNVGAIDTGSQLNSSVLTSQNWKARAVDGVGGFIGLVLENNIVKTIYNCGLYNGVPFCLETTYNSARLNDVYNSNKQLLNSIYNGLCYEGTDYNNESGNNFYRCGYHTSGRYSTVETVTLDYRNENNNGYRTSYGYNGYTVICSVNNWCSVTN